MIGGLGPTFIFNSATDDRLGLGKWSVGPTLAVVSIPDPWVVGALVQKSLVVCRVMINARKINAVFSPTLPQLQFP